jgi:hypothetical protein
MVLDKDKQLLSGIKKWNIRFRSQKTRNRRFRFRRQLKKGDGISVGFELFFVQAVFAHKLIQLSFSDSGLAG